MEESKFHDPPVPPPSSFSGPPMSLVRPVAYDPIDLLPRIEKGFLSDEPPTQGNQTPRAGGRHTNITTNDKNDAPTRTPPAQRMKTPNIDGANSSPSRVGMASSLSRNGRRTDHFPSPTSPPGTDGNKTPRISHHRHQQTSHSSNRAPSSEGDHDRPATSPAQFTRPCANQPNTPSPPPRTPRIQHGTGLMGVLDIFFPTPPSTGIAPPVGTSSSEVSPRRHRALGGVPTTPNHRPLLATQHDQLSQTSRCTNHSTNLGPFQRPSTSPQYEWPATSPAGREAAAIESLIRIDATIRERMDQVARAKALSHLDILDDLYTNAIGAFSPLSPRSPTSPTASPSSFKVPPKGFTRTIFDPIARMERVRKFHRIAAERARLDKEAEEEEARRRDEERKRLAKEDALQERKHAEERNKIHQHYQQCEEERKLRKSQAKDASLAESRAHAEKRQAEFERHVAFIQAHSASLASSGALSKREERTLESERTEEERRRKDEQRWHATRQSWREQLEMLSEKKMKQAEQVRLAKVASEREKREAGLHARKERDERIMKHILSMQDHAKEARESQERKEERQRTQEERERRAHIQARDAWAEEARKKRSDRLESLKAEETRIRMEQLAKEQALKKLASAGYRETIRANTTKGKRSGSRSASPAKSPRRTQATSEEEGGGVTPNGIQLQPIAETPKAS